MKQAKAHDLVMSQGDSIYPRSYSDGDMKRGTSSNASYFGSSTRVDLRGVRRP